MKVSKRFTDHEEALANLTECKIGSIAKGFSGPDVSVLLRETADAGGVLYLKLTPEEAKTMGRLLTEYGEMKQ
jgi:hypothetical protein